MSGSFASDLEACQRLMRGGSHSFFVASRLLPRQAREAAIALYAFCRVADDAIDELPLAHGNAEAQTRARRDQLEQLHRRLEALYAGQAFDHPADRAFAHVALAYRLPVRLPQLLLEGFAWDLEGRRYCRIEELEAYAARVAGTVGAMMALIMGVSQPQVLARACELGLAMQLTNIARDVGADARAGRLYLPLDWLVEARLDPERFLAEPLHGPQLGGVVARLLAHADRLYKQADTAVDALPWRCRPAIAAASRVYAEIGREVERSGLDAINRRAVVPLRRKLALLGLSIVRVLGCSPVLGQRSQRFAMRDSVRDLVDAALVGRPATGWILPAATRQNRDPQQAPSQQALSQQARSQLGPSQQAPSQQGPLQQALSQQGPLQQALSQQALSQQAPSRQATGQGLRGFGQLADLFERLERIDREDRMRQHPGYREA